MKYNELKTTFCAKIENVMLARAIGTAFLVDLDLKLNFINEVKTYYFFELFILDINIWTLIKDIISLSLQRRT